MLIILSTNVATQNLLL